MKNKKAMGVATIHTTICRMSTIGIKKKNHKAILKTEK